MGAVVAEFGGLTEPDPPERLDGDREGKRDERLAGREVRGRALAADELLAGLQRQHVARARRQLAAFRGARGKLLGAADDAAGQLSQVLIAGGEEPERGPAEVRPAGEVAPLAGDDVRPGVARGAQ